MALYKNVASQKIAIFAYDKTTGAAKTGDAANITAYLSLNFGAAAAVTDTNPTELSSANMPGWYVFDLTQAETNAESLILAPKSSTSNIVIDQIQVHTADSLTATSSALSAVGGDVTSILADTNELQTDWVNGGRLDLILDGRASQTSVDDLETRLTATRAGYLDKLNVSGTLAHSDDAATYKADVSSLATAAAVAALNNLSAAEAQTAASAALTAYDAATGADVSGISVPTATQIADAVLSRGVVNIEDTADAGSLAELLLGAFESAVSGTTWTIRKTGGGTFSTRTVATDPNADPIVSVT